MKLLSILFGSITALALAAGSASAADRLEGKVIGGGAPIAKSAVTLWAAGADAPQNLLETRTDADGIYWIGLHHSQSGLPRNPYLVIYNAESRSSKNKKI